MAGEGTTKKAAKTPSARKSAAGKLPTSRSTGGKVTTVRKSRQASTPRRRAGAPKVGAGGMLVRLDRAQRRDIRTLDETVAGATEVTLVRGPKRMSVTGPLLAAIQRVAAALDRGQTITVSGGDRQLVVDLDLDGEVTSQQAADLLNVSRPHVVKLAHDGALPYRRVGNRHRFRVADVLTYREQARRDRAAALEAIAPEGGYTAEDF